MLAKDASHYLTGEVRAFLADVAAALRGQGRTASAASVERTMAQIRDESAMVVVVGEKKRGKSSLINALIERPALLPVGVDVATSVHLVVRYGEPERAVVVDGDNPQGRDIGLDEIAEYAGLDPGTQRPRRDGVDHVEVFLPAPILARNLALVDTPGVGGLVAGHAAITLATLTRADALLFVVNGSTELTASELRFLVRAAERISTVMFVLTQTDRHPKWEEVLKRNRELIGTQAPQYADAPWFPVSSRRRSDATVDAAAGRQELAARRYGESGFAELETALREAVGGRAEAVRMANTVQLAKHMIVAVIGEAEQRVRALQEDRTLLAEVLRQQKLLAEHERLAAGWRSRLDQRFQQEVVHLRIRVDARLADLEDSTVQRIEKEGEDLLAVLPADLDAATRGLCLELENDLHARLTSITVGVAEEFGAGGAVLAAVELTLPVDPPPALEVNRPSRGLVATADRAARYADLGTASGVAAGVLVFPWLAPVIGVVVVAVLGRISYKQEEREMRRAGAQRYVEQRVQQFRVHLHRLINDGMDTSKNALAAHVDLTLGRTRLHLARVIEEQEAAVQMERGVLSHRRKAAEARLEELSSLRERATDIIERLSEN